MSSDYVCTLDEASQKVAKDELFEDPKERLGQVETLRKWISEQDYLTSPTGTEFLLAFLRTAKFSQLRAREILQGYLTIKTKYPDWLNDLDSADPKVHRFLRTGYMIPIPERNEQGRKIFVVNEGSFNKDVEKFTPADVIRATMVVSLYLIQDENALVNGSEMLDDYTHFSVKSMTFWGMENMKKMTKLWEGNLPGRFKAMYFYNTNPLFESIVAVCKPLLSKKMQNRFHMCGKNMEDVYKVIPPKYLPVEYLPDDYKGPHQGTTQDIIENLIRDIQQPKVRERILHETSSKFTIDLKKVKTKDAEPAASFRKLNVD